VIVGRGGWLQVLDEAIPVDLYVRVEQTTHGYEVAELHVSGGRTDPDAVIGARLMERISYEGIRRCANHFLNEKIRAFLDEPLEHAAEHVRDTYFVNTGPDGMSFEQRVGRADFRRADVQPVSPQMDVPPGKRRSDEFYRSVGALHDALRRTEARPIDAIAKANGVPLATVRGWVRRAKQLKAMDRAESEIRLDQCEDED